MGRAGPRLSRLARVRHHPRRAAATGRPAPRTARPANQTPPTGFATPYPNRHNTNRFRRDRITSPTSGTYIRPHLHRYWDATFGGELLVDELGGQSLAGPAGHDQLAAVGSVKALHHRVDRLALMGPGSFRWRPAGTQIRWGARPVDLGGFQVTEQQNARLLLLGLDRALGDTPNQVGSRDQQPERELRPPRLGQEGIHVALDDPGGVIRLRLDRPQLSATVLGDEVDTGVSAPSPRPLIPEPPTCRSFVAAMRSGRRWSRRRRSSATRRCRSSRQPSCRTTHCWR